MRIRQTMKRTICFIFATGWTEIGYAPTLNGMEPYQPLEGDGGPWRGAYCTAMEVRSVRFSGLLHTPEACFRPLSGEPGGVATGIVMPKIASLSATVDPARTCHESLCIFGITMPVATSTWFAPLKGSEAGFGV